MQPLPYKTLLQDDKVAFGSKVFHDKRLSHDNTLACASCHGLDKGGTDQRSHAMGIGNFEGAVNAPTVLNSGLNFKQFWNGRAETLENQADGPTNNSKEMGSNWKEVISKLNQDSAFVEEYKKIYKGEITEDGLRDAIATFERSLLTVNSKFDKYLEGDKNALDADEKKGYELFKGYGCASCHQGQNVGGNMFQKLGTYKDYFQVYGQKSDADLGLYLVTKKEEDKHFFRVPSLRNISVTAPYFHDGSAQRLDQAVEVMAQFQLGRLIPLKDRTLIEKFLESLTGDQPKAK